MKSIWSDDMPRILTERRELPKTAEVVIIGGGMAGLLCACLLKEAGVQAIVLEAAEVCSGQTGNTTAKITSQHGLIYSKLTDIFDEQTASKFGRLNQRAIEEYERIILGRGIECGFKRLPSYLYTKTVEGAEQLERERTAAKRAGIKASIVYETELPFPVKMALKYENQAQFHPLKFLKGMIDELEIYEHERVLWIKGNEVMTARGTVTAKRIVLATHFPFVNFPGFYFARMHQERSYVLGIQIPKTDGPAGNTLQGMYYGVDADGLSFRSAENVILLGGKSHRTGVQQVQNPWDALRKEAGQLWPGYEEVACWAAQDCMTLDSLPYIGQFSKWRPNWYVATGFEKWGMTSSMAAAMIIKDLILGNKNSYAGIVSPGRRWTKQALKTLIQEGGTTIRNFATFRGPRCPHLGCKLEWNRYEKTWDCPCHGSRFRVDKSILDNPAQLDMNKQFPNALEQD